MFKKASNMNHCLNFSAKLEDELQRLMDEDGRAWEDFTIEEEGELYKQALDTIIEGEEHKSWAAGNLRIGEIILLIDSDTRVVSTRSCTQGRDIVANFSLSLRTAYFWER
jgi:hypothetical protein